MSAQRPRRGDGKPQLTVIFWRDVPSLVKARIGRTRVSSPLPQRFLNAVDGAATRAGKTEHDAYIAEWREETRSCSTDIQQEVDAEAARLDDSFSPAMLKAMVKNGGWKPSDD